MNVRDGFSNLLQGRKSNEKKKLAAYIKKGSKRNIQKRNKEAEATRKWLIE